MQEKGIKIKMLESEWQYKKGMENVKSFVVRHWKFQQYYFS